MRIFIRVYAYLYTRIRARLCAFYARILVNVFLSGTVHFSLCTATPSQKNWEGAPSLFFSGEGTATVHRPQYIRIFGELNIINFQ